MLPCLQTNLNDQLFLLPLCYVQEICPAEPYLKKEDKEGIILGTKTIRDRRIPLLPGSAWLGARTLDRPFSHLILFRLHGCLVGIPASRPGIIVHPAEPDFHPASRGVRDAHGILGCWTDSGGCVYPLLDLHGLLRRRVESAASEKEAITLLLRSRDLELFAPYTAALEETASSMELIRVDEIDEADPAFPPPRGKTIRVLGPDTPLEGTPSTPANGRPDHVTVFLNPREESKKTSRAAQYLHGVDLPLTESPAEFTTAVKQALNLSNALSAE